MESSQAVRDRRGRLVRFLSCWVVAATVTQRPVTLAGPEQVQLDPPVTLKAARSASNADFMRIQSAYALGGGQVLVLDAADRSVSLVDERLQSAKPLARMGNGPTELRLPATILPAEGGGALISDFGAFRWLAVTKGGRPERTIPFGRAANFVVNVTTWGADTLGCFFSAPVPAPDKDRSAYATRVPLWRVCGFGKSVDTLTFLRSAANAVVDSRSLGPNLVLQTTTRPLFAQDLAAISLSGRTAVFRAEAGLVEVFDARLKHEFSIRLLTPRIEVNAEEKAHFRQSRIRTGQIHILSSNGSQGPESRAVRPRLRPPQSLADGRDPAGTLWPTVKPAFLGRPMFDRNETLWIPRTTRASDSAAVYDLIDATGRYAGAYRLETGAQLLGFTADQLLYAWGDEFDGRHVAKMAIPSLRPREEQGKPKKSRAHAPTSR